MGLKGQEYSTYVRETFSALKVINKINPETYK